MLSKKAIAALETVAMTNKDQMIGMKTSRGMGTGLLPIVMNDNFDKVWR